MQSLSHPPSVGSVIVGGVVLLLLLFVVRGFLRWMLGTNEQIRLLKEISRKLGPDPEPVVPARIKIVQQASSAAKKAFMGRRAKK